MVCLGVVLMTDDLFGLGVVLGMVIMEGEYRLWE